jgi:hypothetical protein
MRIGFKAFGPNPRFNRIQIIHNNADVVQSVDTAIPRFCVIEVKWWALQGKIPVIILHMNGKPRFHRRPLPPYAPTKNTAQPFGCGLWIAGGDVDMF